MIASEIANISDPIVTVIAYEKGIFPIKFNEHIAIYIKQALYTKTGTNKSST